MTTATSSNGKGAATAAPNLQLYIDLEDQIGDSDEQAIRARWKFGHELLKERGSAKQLPTGRITEVCAATGRGATEIRFRMKFAERYTEDQVSNAIGDFKTWYGITKHALYEKRDPSPEPTGPKPKQRKNSEGGKANHRLKKDRRENDEIPADLYYMRERVNRAASELEWYNLEGFAWSEWTQWLVEETYDDLIRLQKWTEEALNVTVAHMGDLSRQLKLRKLRERSLDPTSSENERRTAAAAAEKLAGRLALG